MRFQHRDGTLSSSRAILGTVLRRWQAGCVTAGEAGPAVATAVATAADELEEQFRKSFGPEQLNSLFNGDTWGEALVRTRPYSALVAIKDYLEEALGDNGLELDGEFLVRENEVTAF